MSEELLERFRKLTPLNRYKEKETPQLAEIHSKWRELDLLQIKLQPRIENSRFQVLNVLDALGLELSKPVAIESYINEKLKAVKFWLKRVKEEGMTLG